MYSCTGVGDGPMQPYSHKRWAPIGRMACPRHSAIASPLVNRRMFYHSDKQESLMNGILVVNALSSLRDFEVWKVMPSCEIIASANTIINWLGTRLKSLQKVISEKTISNFAWGKSLLSLEYFAYYIPWCTKEKKNRRLFHSWTIKRSLPKPVYVC